MFDLFCWCPISVPPSRINTGLKAGVIDGRMQMFPSQSYSILIHLRPIDGSIRLL